MDRGWWIIKRWNITNKLCWKWHINVSICIWGNQKLYNGKICVLKIVDVKYFSEILQSFSKHCLFPDNTIWIVSLINPWWWNYWQILGGSGYLYICLLFNSDNACYSLSKHVLWKENKKIHIANLWINLKKKKYSKCQDT